MARIVRHGGQLCDNFVHAVTTNPMQSIVALFWRIATFRSGPEAIPFSTFLATTLVVATKDHLASPASQKQSAVNWSTATTQYRSPRNWEGEAPAEPNAANRAETKELLGRSLARPGRPLEEFPKPSPASHGL